MTKEELKTATNDELVEELNYCGYDSYYRDYRDDIVAEIKKRMKGEPVLDKIRAEVYKLPTYYHEIHRPNSVVFRDVVEFDKVLRIINKYKAESEDK